MILFKFLNKDQMGFNEVKMHLLCLKPTRSTNQQQQWKVEFSKTKTNRAIETKTERKREREKKKKKDSETSKTKKSRLGRYSMSHFNFLIF